VHTGQPTSRILQLPFEISDGLRARCAVADRRDKSDVLHLGTNWLTVQRQVAMEDKLILAFYALKQLQPRLQAAAGPPSLDAPEPPSLDVQQGTDALLRKVPSRRSARHT